MSDAPVDVSGVSVTTPGGDTTNPNGQPVQVPQGSAHATGQQPTPVQQAPDHSAALAALQARLDQLEQRNASKPPSTIEWE